MTHEQFNLSSTVTGQKWFCVCVMATNFLELATTLKYLGAKWLPGKKVNFTPCELVVIPGDQSVGRVCLVVDCLDLPYLGYKHCSSDLRS